jgi:hypothetical protein
VANVHLHRRRRDKQTARNVKVRQALAQQIIDFSLSSRQTRDGVGRGKCVETERRRKVFVTSTSDYISSRLCSHGIPEERG